MRLQETGGEGAAAASTRSPLIATRTHPLLSGPALPSLSSAGSLSHLTFLARWIALPKSSASSTATSLGSPRLQLLQTSGCSGRRSLVSLVHRASLSRWRLKTGLTPTETSNMLHDFAIPLQNLVDAGRQQQEQVAQLTSGWADTASSLERQRQWPLFFFSRSRLRAELSHVLAAGSRKRVGVDKGAYSRPSAAPDLCAGCVGALACGSLGQSRRRPPLHWPNLRPCRESRRRACA